jgi:hypothetical protein
MYKESWVGSNRVWGGGRQYTGRENLQTIATVFFFWSNIRRQTHKRRLLSKILILWIQKTSKCFAFILYITIGTYKYCISVQCIFFKNRDHLKVHKSRLWLSVHSSSPSSLKQRSVLDARPPQLFRQQAFPKVLLLIDCSVFNYIWRFIICKIVRPLRL